MYLILGLVSSNLFAQELIHKNSIIYGSAPNWKNQDEQLKLDLIYPSTTKKLPLLVSLHGGTFLNGTRVHLTKLCEQLAKKDFVVANCRL